MLGPPDAHGKHAALALSLGFGIEGFAGGPTLALEALSGSRQEPHAVKDVSSVQQSRKKVCLLEGVALVACYMIGLRAARCHCRSTEARERT